MGASRMIIFHDLLQEKIKEKNETEETLSVSERKNNQWGAIFEKIPDTNFLIFIDTSKNTGELAKLLESVATLHEFPHQTLSEVIRFVSQELGVEGNLAEDICSRLGFYEEFSFGKKYIVGNPDRVYQEIKKLNLF